MLSLLIASDIHAASNDLDRDEAVSWSSTLPEFDTPLRNPFETVSQLLRAEELKVDVLICPGDLADCADPLAQAVTWGRLDRLRQDIGATRLVATVGNHDIDSRLVRSNFDPKANLQSLKPSFPGLSEAECDFFWSRNFVSFLEKDTRFLILNSSAFHGIHSGDGEKKEKEYMHGRVSDLTIEAVINHLGTKDVSLNVLIVHHHIYKNEHISPTDYSEMTGGQKFLRLLSERVAGPWLVIHGHQHYPDLFYGLGASDSPAILSAGSMSRRLTGPLASRALNQIYHLELPVDKYPKIGWKPAGITRSWHWVDQVGWRRTSFGLQTAAIPYGAGFGCRKAPDTWATEIAAEVSKADGRRIEWSELAMRWPALRYVLPSDLRTTVKRLKEVQGAYTSFDDDGYPLEVAMK